MAWTELIAGSIAKSSEVNANFDYLACGGFYYESGTYITNTPPFYLNGNQNISGAVINANIQNAVGSIYFEIESSGFDSIGWFAGGSIALPALTGLTSSGNALILGNTTTDYFYVYDQTTIASGAHIGSFAMSQLNALQATWTGSELLELYKLLGNSGCIYRHSGLSVTLNGSWLNSQIGVDDTFTYKPGSLLGYDATTEYITAYSPTTGIIIGSVNTEIAAVTNFDSICWHNLTGRLFATKPGVFVFSDLGSQYLIGSYVNSSISNATYITITDSGSIWTIDGRVNRMYNSTLTKIFPGSPVDFNVAGTPGRIVTYNTSGLTHLEVRYH